MSWLFWLIVVIIVLAALIGLFYYFHTRSSPETTLLAGNQEILLENQSLRRIATEQLRETGTLLNKEIAVHNLSVKKVAGGYVGIVRGSTFDGCSSFNMAPFNSYAYWIELADDGMINALQLLQLPYSKMNRCVAKRGDVHANGIEDPKLFDYQGEPWVIANCLGTAAQAEPCANTMCIFKVSSPMNTFRILTERSIDPTQRQKNWTAFEYNGNLFVEYSLVPHIIFKVDPSSGNCYRLPELDGGDLTAVTSDRSVRGSGGQAIPWTWQGKDYYLGIAHTRNIRPRVSYLHYFYCFEARPPFKMVAVSKPFKFEREDKIQFAAGISLWEGAVHVSYGVEDCTNSISVYSEDRVADLLDLSDPSLAPSCT